MNFAINSEGDEGQKYFFKIFWEMKNKIGLFMRETVIDVSCDNPRCNISTAVENMSDEIEGWGRFRVSVIAMDGEREIEQSRTIDLCRKCNKVYGCDDDEDVVDHRTHRSVSSLLDDILLGYFEKYGK